MANNIQMPLFAAAANHAGGVSSSAWNDIDHFDVDILAEYLLGDGSLPASSGVTFDFAIDSSAADQTSLISPENSEDGRHPPMADMTTATTTLLNHVTPSFPQGFSSSLAAPQVQPPMMAMSLQQQQLQQPQQQLYYASVPATGTTVQLLQQQEDPSAKRRRLDISDPMMAVAFGAAPPSQQQQQVVTYVNGQNMMPPADMVQVTAVAVAAPSMAMSMAVQQQGRSSSRKKNQTQIDRRRERNRILARRTRLRKKFFFESLQKELMDLQRENFMLKDVVRENVEGGEADKILAECDAMEKLPPAVLEACGQNGELAAEDFNLVSSIQKSQHSFVITDPSLPDNPIVFCSDDFLKVTGYSREQVLGRNCRFLQGTDTCKEKVAMIRKCLENGEDVSVTLLNYTATGKPFWNKLFIASLRDSDSNVVNYIGVTVPVAAPEPDDPEHAKAMAMKEAAGIGGDHGMDDDSSDDEDDC